MNEFLDFTHKQLVRIYPSGTRVNSSNYDPVLYWKSGCQLVALNFQTFDRGMQVNSAFFGMNGQCGFILKPPSLLAGGSFNEPADEQVEIKIISGQQLPKPKKTTSVNNISDPYVEIEIISPTSNVALSSQIFKTKTVNDNGLLPIWNEAFSITIKDPEWSFIRFSVFDFDTLNDDFIGSYTIPYKALAKGYRHIPLYNSGGDLCRFSTIFVCIR